MSEDEAATTRAAGIVATPLRVARLSRQVPTDFALRPDAETCAAIAAAIGVTRLRKLAFAGQVAPIDGGGWELTGDLGASMVQPCGVTLAPVTTRIEERVLRRYLPGLAEPAVQGGEVELPEDVDAEPLGAVIDPGAVMLEALALAVPAWPRAEGAALEAAVFAPPGVAPMRDEDTRPLAALAALRDRLKDRD